MGDAAMKADRPQVPPKRDSSNVVKIGYLVLYNFISAILWFAVLGRVVAIVLLMRRPDQVYNATGQFVKWTQTLAMLEVVHSLVGIVRAPVFTTFMQVASRFVLVWAVVDQFPYTSSASFAYTTMLVAWSVTEVVRYSYFVYNLTSQVPPVLSWLRYNMFFVLYPMGISSEWWLCYRAIDPASKRNPYYAYVLYFILALYFPGAYVLYTHMMTQRRKVLRGKQKAT